VETGLVKVLWALKRISPAVICWKMRHNKRGEGESRKEKRIEY